MNRKETDTDKSSLDFCEWFQRVLRFDGPQYSLRELVNTTDDSTPHLDFSRVGRPKNLNL